MSETELRQSLYPPIEAYNTGFLKVSELHTLYYEECGNPKGCAALFLHGGPGFGFTPDDRRYFNPKLYRIVLFDQRGGGKSTPAGELRDNTTWTCIDDIEKLRLHLGIQKWGIVFGGSWGSTLSLAYSQAHPSRVKAIVIRGIYTSTSWELKWLYSRDGVGLILPDHFEDFENWIPQGERHNLLNAYYRRLSSDDKDVVMNTARRWSRFQMASSTLLPNKKRVERPDADPEWAVKHARLECHYAVHGSFLRSQTQLLDDVAKIRHIPCTIVQGRYDVNCPMRCAWDLHVKWPEADVVVVPDAGHSGHELGTISELVKAADKYATL